MKIITKTLKTASLAMCCIIMCFSFAACADGFFRLDGVDLDKEMAEVVKSVDFTADENYKGSITIARNAEPDQITVLDALVTDFKKIYPNMTVNIKQLPSANYKDSLQNMNSACKLNGQYDTFPDVFWASNTDTSEYQLLDMVMPIDYFDAKDDSVDLSDLFPAMLDDCKVGGHVYLMPRDCDRLVMYYNKDYTDRKNVTIKEDEAYTKTEFLDILSRLTGVKNPATQKDVAALDAFWAWDSLLWPLVKSYGGAVVKQENGNTVSALNSNEVFEAYKFVKELNIKGYTTIVGGTGNYKLFMEGNAVLLFGVRATLTELVENIPNLGVAPMPNLAGDSDDTYYVGSGCSGYAMYRNASNPTGAWLFLKYVMSERGQNTITATGNSIPVLASLFEDENAAWRKMQVGNNSNFNHAAFVYKPEASLTAQMGYRDLIKPTQAISEVSRAFTESIEKAVNQTKADTYLDATKGIRRYLKSYGDEINNAIKLASGV